jgi:hypothetical protein
MTLLNINDIEYMNMIIKNLDIIFELDNINISYNRKKLMKDVDNYYEKHLILEIDKDNFLEYLKTLYQKYIFEKLRNNSIKEYNILGIIDFIDEIEIGRYTYFESKIIYFSIYNLDKSIKLINENINNLNLNNENYLNLIKELKETNEYLNNTINELKEANNNQMNLIKELIDDRQSINKFDKRCERC